MAYAVSVALAHGELRLGHFTDEGFRDESARARMGSVTASESGVPPVGEAAFGDGYTVVTVESSSGASERLRVDLTYGDARSPLSEADLDAKFADCCREGGLSPAAARQLLAVLRAVPSSASLGGLAAALRRGSLRTSAGPLPRPFGGGGGRDGRVVLREHARRPPRRCEECRDR